MASGPRLKFEKLYHRDGYGTPLMPTAEVTETLMAKGLIQEQAPTAGRFEEIDALAASSDAIRDGQLAGA